MTTITANDLKTRGIAAIEAMLANQTEAVVSVRGAERYVVMELSQYHYLRECELEAALVQSRADLAAGRFVKESPQDHIARAQALNAASTPPDAPRARKRIQAAKASSAPVKRAGTGKPASPKRTQRVTR